MRPLIAMVAAMLTPLSGACAKDAEGEGHSGDDRYAVERQSLVRAIGEYAETIGEAANPKILAAIQSVPRHLLVPVELRAEAYNDYPLPIGHAQTISQPSLVALMTHLLRPERDDVLLEVGTGSGYQAAILSKLVDKVYTIEIVEPLARKAERNLKALAIDNVHVRHGDGYLGWPERAPFDGIIVTAGAEHVPPPLLEQLKPGGHLVIPVGPADAVQELRLITKGDDGEIREEKISWVRFVPLTRPTE